MTSLVECEEKTVVLFAPVGKDAVLLKDALARVGIASVVCKSMMDVCTHAEGGAGAIFLTEEAFDKPAEVEMLVSLVDRQPAWSDFPIIVSYGKASRPASAFFPSIAALDKRGYVSLLERPTNPRLLFNAVRSALRARERQYERRRLLEELSAAKARAEIASQEIRESLQRETEARQSAEEANRAKDIFLATLSHELRTPLNAILGFSELLLQEEPGTPEFESALATIVRNANVQRELIDDILDVSRIISDKLPLEKTPLDLVRIVYETLESFRIAAKQKEQTINVVSDVESATADGDAKRLRQIFWNLLSNAVKFTPAGGTIKVEMRKSAESFEVSVIDSGEGIDLKFLPHVFDRFRQQDGSSTKRFGGLGLGLSIVRHLVEMHGGTVKAESAGKGRGACFRVYIPILVDDNLGRDVAVQPISSSGMGQSMPSTFEDGRRTCILVVDDQADSRLMVRAVLERAGIGVVEVDSASEARKALSENNFDAIVCDIGMPDEDGLSLIKSLRESSAFSIPAAALSGFVSKEDKRRAMAAGFDLHLSKPVFPGEILTAVSKLLEMNRAHASRDGQGNVSLH